MDPVATTTSGKVLGASSEGAQVFLGVPYADAPFGARRFLPPAAPEPWDGVRDALRYGPTAPQKDPVATIIPEPVERGEDILNLNVFTPDLGDARLPVLVWIHGGGFVSGCNRSPWYRGERFARDGVVVVAVGYRLGVEGFLDIEGAPPNRAVLDWIAALGWVQENIAGFGGDPSKVTIGGQSAGSAACLTLLSNPRAKGLFRGVIAMSGTSDTRMPRQASTDLGQKIAAHLGVDPTRDGLAAFSADDLVEAHAAVATNPFTAQALGTAFDPRLPALKPYVDGDVIPAHPYKEISAGVGGDIALVAGSTVEELNGLIRNQRDRFDAEVAANALSAMGLEGDRLARYVEHVGGDVVDAFAQAATDRSFRVPLVQLLEDRAGASAPTFGYQFSWKSPLFDGAVGACHCLDVPFVWDLLDAERVTDGLHGPNPPQSLATQMHGDFVRFVTDGDPGWPHYDRAARRMKDYDDPPAITDDPLRIQREIF